MSIREDRIGRYFRKYLDKFVFNEFSADFRSKIKAGDLMENVPVPLRKEDVECFASGEGVSMQIIAENMTWVIGCDPGFQYTKDYVAILNKIYGKRAVEGVIAEGRAASEQGDMDSACIHFRAALCMNPDSLDAMYSYARACRAMYLDSGNEEYVGRFKAEAFDFFELITEVHPEFAQSYYYLGYAYLNMGLYTKAKLTWDKFMEYSENASNGKDRKEIRQRLQQLEEPVMIEQGCNDIMAGRYQQGIACLERFKTGRFKTWWPLFFYLGIGYEMTGQLEEAIASFKKVLTMNASHIETMEELVAIYMHIDDEENAFKYQNKIRMVEAALREDQMIHNAETFEEDKKLVANAPDEQKPEIIEKI
ncbi:MAG: hypothetical protein J6M22_06610 [Firmicutes bacterium]|nr:hypothetical protein [Bacillota bacterium]